MNYALALLDNAQRDLTVAHAAYLAVRSQETRDRLERAQRAFITHYLNFHQEFADAA